MAKTLGKLQAERDDYKERYEFQCEMRSKAEDERDRWQADAKRYSENADYWRERAEQVLVEATDVAAETSQDGGS